MRAVAAQPVRLRRYLWAAAAIWTAAVGISLVRTVLHEKEEALGQASATARCSFDCDTVYRAWNASHGGVYVPVTADTLPNPHLAHVPERDLTTPSGRRLTLVNPDYMVRQIHQLGAERSGLRGHITSLRYLRPEDAPDDWEKRVLETFEHGAKEASAIETVRGQQSLRLMRPLLMEESCLRCHTGEGLRVGDVRGGISVAVPLEPLWAPRRTDAIVAAGIHGLLWVLGLAGLSVAAGHIRRRVRERDQAEEQLRAQADFLETVLETIPAPLNYKDCAGRYVGCNAAFAEYSGRARQEIIGKTVDEVYPPETAAKVRAVDAALFANPGTQSIGSTFDLPDGQHRDMILHKATYRDPNGNVVGIVSVGTDITQHRRAEQELHAALEQEKLAAQQLEVAGKQLEVTNLVLEAQTQQMTAQQQELRAINAELTAARNQAEAASVAKSEFLANMSHEIRTPLAAILGYAELVAEEVLCCTVCPDHARCAHRNRTRQQAETICSNGRHLLSIINDILDLSKIEAGKLVVERIRCSPFQVIAAPESLMRVRAAGKGLTFTVEYEGPIPESIVTDPTCVRQILLNLLGNAFKFTETGGVRLVVRLVDGTPPAGEGLAGPRLQFRIIDTGIGIPEEQLDRLFGAFTQADSSTTRRFGGTGLGLAISKRLAESLGGTISVVSTPGRGSEFTATIATGPLEGVRLLTAPQDAGVAKPEADPAAAAVETATPLVGRILLAEDGPDNQRLLAYILRKAGAEVTVAENGQVAAELALSGRAAGRPFDVILMDMEMPVLDGYAATRRLREAGYDWPIIALTAHAMASDRGKCLAAGCDDFASKPIDRRRLIECVRRHLRGSSGTPAGSSGSRCCAETTTAGGIDGTRETCE